MVSSNPEIPKRYPKTRAFFIFEKPKIAQELQDLTLFAVHELLRELFKTGP